MALPPSVRQVVEPLQGQWLLLVPRLVPRHPVLPLVLQLVRAQALLLE